MNEQERLEISQKSTLIALAGTFIFGVPVIMAVVYFYCWN